MASESISIPILTPGANDAARNIKQVGDAAAGTGAKLDVAAASLDLWNASAARSAKADTTLVASKKAHAKADALLSDAENVLAGKAATTTKLFADQGRVLDDTGEKAGRAAGFFSSLAGIPGSIPGGGIGALVGAGVALSPVLLTLGFGLGGLAAAAYGIAKPIENAASATGGLSKNLGSLNPAERTVATGLLGLQKQFGTFQAALQPEVLGIFNQGLQLAGTVMRGIEPIAAATGSALGTLLDQIDAEFKSGTWQNFFAFMARTAAPDVQLLGSTFVNLTAALPPLLQLLQPVATDVLGLASGLTKLVQVSASAGQSVDNVGGHMNTLQKITAGLRTVLFAPGVGLLDALKVLHIVGSDAASGVMAAGQEAAKAGPAFFTLTTAVNKLNTSMTTLVGNLLTLQGSNVSWKQSMQAAEKQLDSNTAGLAGNSKNALANRAAVIQSTNAAISFASQQLTLGKNIDAASRTVQDQIKWLQSLHSNSSTVRQELEALRKEEQLLEAQRIRQTISVQGLGQWSVSQSLAPGAGHRRALGGLIPGHGSGDTYPALLTPGEVVVPRPMVSAGAVDHLRGSLPGFAAGGLVGSYAGSVSGLAPWIKRDDQATISLIDQAVVRATVAGIRAAASAAATTGIGAAGPGGGAPAANAALARRLMPAWSSGANWTAWNYVAMAESGWSQFARNPSSGAYGIPQALPPGKMGAAANPPQSNPAAQINWMIGYMQSVYGGPIGAAAHESAFHNYDRGGVLPPGLSLAYNGTGRPEMVLPNSGGAAVKLQIEWTGGSAGDPLLQWIQKNVRIRGGGNVQAAFGKP